MNQVVDALEERQEVERMLLDGAQQFLQARHSLQRARCWRSEGRRFDARLWSAMGECGWLGMRLPEELGGFGLPLSAAAALAARLGAALLPDPFVGCAVAPAALLAALPASDLRDALAGELVDGAQVLTLAWQAQPGEIDPGWSGVVLARDAQGLVLDGTCVAVEGAADQWLVAASEDGQPRLVRVAAQAAGVRRDAQLRADGSAMDTLHFDAVRISADALLATGAAARRALGVALDETRVVAAAYLAGLAEAALDSTAAYLAQRVQFGQPLAALQTVRHRVVDLDLQKRLAFASWRKACEIHAAVPYDFAAAASAAKARCSELALRATREAMQLHGAMGYTEEADIGLFADAALRHAPAFGNAPAHRRRFAALAFGRPAAPELRGGFPAGPHPATPDAWAQLSDSEFAARLEAWLQAHYPPEWRQPIVLRLRGAAERDWLGTLHRHGLRAPGIARAHGGMGLPLRKQLLYKQVFDAHGVARVLDMGSTLLAPILIRYGTAEQQARFLPGILRGEEVWCQGYSEPGAGSDLASLRTRAERRGDVLIVNGQKIWTSHANNASRIFMLVRTGQYERKQQGISLLLVDLNSPGITVRPIVNMAGDDEFCEVFFDNVEVPASRLLGPLDDGWNVAKSLLGVERLVNGSPALAQQAFNYLRQMLDAAPDMRAAALPNDRLAQLACELHDFHGLYAETCAVALAGQTLDAEYSVLKLVSTELFQKIVELVMDLAAERGAVNGAQAFGAVNIDLHRLYMVSRPGTIYGGASEVQRDILARSLLPAKTR
ncbi:acyl-CoA dehydrogenase [Comamonas antarctica]|uniref:acyl-CoA dehydrogenase n=1 Tax=Comamonas antarctica TaxID=2743470 RepID=UPI0028EF6054|nr:acyl-CoA dehydrogenase [Comamonas antarctica]